MKSQDNILPIEEVEMPGRVLTRSSGDIVRPAAEVVRPAADVEIPLRNTTRPAANLGAILIQEGKLSESAAEKVMELQRRLGMRFGQAALHLKLINEEDLKRALAKQYDFHYLEPGSDGVSREVVAAYDPNDPRVEEMRVLRTQLLIRWFNPQAGQRILAITSPGHCEGRSYVAANLAVVFSHLGYRTLLIDADLRSPRQHRLFDLSERTGLSTVLSGRAGAAVAAAIPGFNGLKVLPSGPVPPNPQELLSRGAFASLLKEVQDQFDIVLIDTPPAKLYADAQSVAFRAGSALTLARRHNTRIADAADVVREFGDTGIRVVGTVMNVF